MKNKVYAWGRFTRRDVNEPDQKAFAFQIDDPGPAFTRITISPHDMKRTPQEFQGEKVILVGYVTQMPDLVRLRKQWRKMSREPVVRVRNDRDSHAQ